MASTKKRKPKLLSDQLREILVRACEIIDGESVGIRDGVFGCEGQ